MEMAPSDPMHSVTQEGVSPDPRLDKLLDPHPVKMPDPHPIASPGPHLPTPPSPHLIAGHVPSPLFYWYFDFNTRDPVVATALAHSRPSGQN